MRTRSRSSIWNRTYRTGNEHFFDVNLSSLKYNNVWYFSPFQDLANYHLTSRAIQYASASTYNDSETITDVGGPFMEYKKGVPQWNPVTHTMRRCGNAPYTAVSRLGALRCAEGWERRIPPTFSQVPAVPSLTPYQAMAVYGACYNDLIPQFESDVSLANFIYELKDFKGLMRYIPRGIDRLKLLRNDVRWVVPPVERPVRRSRETLRSYLSRTREWQSNRRLYMLDTASKLDLTYHYAIRPFVNDVSACIDMFGGLSEAVQSLNNQGSVRNVRHGTRVENASYSILATGKYRPVTMKRNVYRLTAEMTYKLRPVDKLSQFMAWSGLRVTPQKLWDMVPFSFVVDHFCNIGEALGSFDRGEVDFSMTRLMESVTSEAACVTAADPAYCTYERQGGGSAGLAEEMYLESPYKTWYPLSWSTIRSYVRQEIVPVPYIAPPTLPRLQIPSMDAIRLDLDLVYNIFLRGNRNPAWRTE